MKSAMKGIVHGKTIELDEAPGLPEGQPVTVTVEPLAAGHLPNDAAARDALQRAAGAWSADQEDELDRYLEWNRRQRKAGRPEIAG
jgi:hypothetical protein